MEKITQASKIYLACPYSGTPREMASRFALVTKYAGELISLGKIVFSPVTHGHAISKYTSVPLTWDFWRNINDSFVEWCDELHILCLPGWEKSEGVAWETKLATSLGKKVRKSEIRDSGVEVAHEIGNIGDAPIN